MKPWALAIGMSTLLIACESGAEVEDGVFLPIWSADGEVPLAIVQGVLVEEDGCLYVDWSRVRTLPIWEEGLGFADGALLGFDGEAIAEVGEIIHGGGGYYDGPEGRAHIEDLSGESVPERCVPEGQGFAVIYDVQAGAFKQ